MGKQGRWIVSSAILTVVSSVLVNLATAGVSAGGD